MFRALRLQDLKAATFLLAIALLVVLYHWKDCCDYKNILPHEDIGTIHLNKDVRKDVYSWPKCERNVSVEKITDFSSLPRHIQDFLYYKHCRHFPMLLDIPDKCGGADRSAEVFLLLVIKSSPPNYERREVLRKTWAAERKHNGMWIRRVFISGTMDEGFEKVRLNHLLRHEQSEYNDILQWDFKDSFYNLTLKQMLFLEWMESNCPNTRFLLNGDDDIYAHTGNVVDYFQSLKDNNGDKHLFTGHVITHVGPIREIWSKYYIPVQVHESDSYPPYCGGGGFLLSGYTATVIYNMSKSIPLIPIDDVYIGMCLEKAGLGPSYHMGVNTLGLWHPVSKEAADDLNPCYFRDVIVIHRFLPARLYYMWNRVNDPDLNCSVAGSNAAQPKPQALTTTPALKKPQSSDENNHNSEKNATSDKKQSFENNHNSEKKASSDKKQSFENNNNSEKKASSDKIQTSENNLSSGKKASLQTDKDR